MPRPNKYYRSSPSRLNGVYNSGGSSGARIDSLLLSPIKRPGHSLAPGSRSTRPRRLLPRSTPRGVLDSSLTVLNNTWDRYITKRRNYFYLLPLFLLLVLLLANRLQHYRFGPARPRDSPRPGPGGKTPPPQKQAVPPDRGHGGNWERELVSVFELEELRATLYSQMKAVRGQFEESVVALREQLAGAEERARRLGEEVARLREESKRTGTSTGTSAVAVGEEKRPSGAAGPFNLASYYHGARVARVSGKYWRMWTLGEIAFFQLRKRNEHSHDNSVLVNVARRGGRRLCLKNGGEVEVLLDDTYEINRIAYEMNEALAWGCPGEIEFYYEENGEWAHLVDFEVTNCGGGTLEKVLENGVRTGKLMIRVLGYKGGCVDRVKVYGGESLSDDCL